MLKGQATLKYEEGRLLAKTNAEILSYYLWLFTKNTHNTVAQNTVRSAHITVCAREFFPQIKTKDLIKFNGKKVTFQYDPALIYSGGWKKGFLGFYLPILSEDIDEVRKELNIDINDWSNRLHLSLFSDKAYREFRKKKQDEKKQ